VFDEAWYLQPTRPPTAQLLYDLGVEAEEESVSIHGPLQLTPQGTITPITIPWPPLPPQSHPKKVWDPPPSGLYAPLPLRLTDAPTPLTDRAAWTRVTPSPLPNRDLTSQTVTAYLIGPHNMDMINMSPDPYGRTFEEPLDLRKFNLSKHPTAGLRLITKDGRLILASMDTSSPGARIDKWRSRICGAWLVSIGDTAVSTLAEAQSAFWLLSENNAHLCLLTFTHPEFSPDISHNGLPIISHDNYSQLTHDQLNNRLDLLAAGPRFPRVQKYSIVESSDVRQYLTRVMRLTRGRLLKQDDWKDWQILEYLQLNQYWDQGCLGMPTAVDPNDAVFHLVWTYNIKAVDGRKKARCVCG
jgi:hypothetical protein